MIDRGRPKYGEMRAEAPQSFVLAFCGLRPVHASSRSLFPVSAPADMMGVSAVFAHGECAGGRRRAS